MPIEPAFVAAFQYDENLFAEAFEKDYRSDANHAFGDITDDPKSGGMNARVRTPARLLTAPAHYDKLVFVEAMDKMGGQLQTVQTTYDGAMNTLTRGRGNLISQANKFVNSVSG